MNVLMLAPRMALGFGVAEAVAMQVRQLRRLGIGAAVGCLERDRTYADVRPRRVAADPAAIRDAAHTAGATVIIAHGTPYFEALPALTGEFATIAYEYGDPTPELFGHDAAERRAIVERKRAAVYPAVTAVAAISDFIRHDIAWPAAWVIPLGVEHVVDPGPKPWLPPRAGDQPLRVGTLMRLGAGEARYKGHDELLDLVVRARALAPGIRFEIMGRGTQAEAERFRTAGFVTHLNATDDERGRFLRELDVFVSPSLWEGCNLPLVEAQALGTPGLAFDTGAHPEFTPLVFDSIDAMALQLAAYAEHPLLLADHGRMAYRFVRATLSWQRTGLLLARLAAEANGDAVALDPPRSGPIRRRVASARRLRNGVGQVGWRAAARYHVGRLRDR